MKTNHNVLGKMTAREIAKNFLQYLSMIVITMLAVTLFCGFVSNAKTLEGAIEKYKKDSNISDLVVQTSLLSQADYTYFDESGLDIEYRIYVEGKVNGLSAKIYVGKGEITSPIVSSGESGVLIDKQVAERENIKIGDTVTMTFNGMEHDFVITGLMTFIEVANTYSVCPIYLTEDALLSTLNLPKELLRMVYNQVLIKTPDIEKTRADIKEYFEAKTTNNLLYVFDENSFEGVVSLQSEVDQSLKMIYVFPVIFLLVSVLVILTTISQLILRERTNIGTLKAIGIANKQILFHYASFGVVLCLIGGLIGVILGPQIVTNVMRIKYNLVYSFPKISGVVYSPIWSVIAIVIISFLSAIIGVCVASSVIKEQPADCMRPLPPRESFLVKMSTKHFNGNSEKQESSKNLSFKMAIRNIFIKPSRAFMTIIGIAGCVALLVCSFGIGDTINNSVDVELKKNYFYDVSATYADSSEASLVSHLEELKASGDIDAFETFKSFYVTVAGDNVDDIFVYCYKPNSVFTKIDVSNSQVCLSKSLSESLNIGVGDEIKLTFGGNKATFKIDKVVETAVTNGLFVDTDIFDSFQHTNNLWVKAKDPNKAKEQILDFVASATTNQDLKDHVENMISSIDTIKLTLMAFAIALSVVVLYNLSLLNVKERNRDIATLKVLGFSNGQIGASLLYEIMILATLGTLVGLLLGYPILYLVLSINKVEVINYIFSIKFVSYLYSALISILTALAINLLFMPVIRKVNMIVSLKSVE